MLRVEPALKEQYVATGQVQLAFHPMNDLGDAAFVAHKAAVCAAQQSPLGYWEMHDTLFARQNELYRATPDIYAALANELGLDGAALTACMESAEAGAQVTRLDEARRAAGIRQRPTFDINGRLVTGALPLAQFQQVIDEALANGGQ